MNLTEIQDNYESMDWEGFRDAAGDLTSREIEIYDKTLLEDVPALIEEVSKLKALVVDIYNEDLPEHLERFIESKMGWKD